MENKRLFTVIISVLIIVTLGIVVWGSKNKNIGSSQAVTVEPSAPVFFYGNTCPHCADVKEWMRENKVEEKIKLVKKEVYGNKANALELSKAAESCGMDTASIGVPFLFTPEGKCLVGTPDIVNYLSEKAGLSGKEAEQ